MCGCLVEPVKINYRALSLPDDCEFPRDVLSAQRAHVER